MLNFVADAAAALAEMRRVARPGASVAAYVWDYAGRMELIRHFWDAAVDCDPACAAQHEGARFPLCDPTALASLFGGAGLAAVETTAIEVPTPFADFDDYWAPFLGGQGPAPGYVASLDDGARERLRSRLRERLPLQPDGSIALVARAWAVQARVGQ